MEKEKTVVAETKKNEQKATKVVFDRKAFYQNMAKAFSKSKVVDVIADTETEKPRENPVEYEFIHFYKKGTTTKLFELFTKNKDCKFCVGLTLADFLQKDDKYTMTPVEKTKKTEENGEKVKRVVYIRVTCSHEDAVEVAQKIIDAYESNKITEVVELPKKAINTKAKAKKSAKKAQ